jgi:hypothetical protein
VEFINGFMIMKIVIIYSFSSSVLYLAIEIGLDRDKGCYNKAMKVHWNFEEVICPFFLL